MNIPKFIKTRKESKMQQRLETVKNIYHKSETENEAIQKATTRVIEEINKHPDMSIIEFLKMIQEEEKLSTDIIVEVTKQLSEAKPEKTVAIVEKLDLPEGKLQEIIRETNSMEVAKKIVNQIPSEELQKAERRRLEKIETQRRKAEKQKKEVELGKILSQRYETCGDIRGPVLIQELKGIKEQTESPKVYEWIQKVLAKKAAIEWRKTGMARIESMVNVIPAQEMLKGDFAKLVGGKFEMIKETQKSSVGKDYQFQEEDLQNLILREVAKNVATTYVKVGIIDIPQCEAMQQLSEEQSEMFIKEIQIYIQNKDKEKIKNFDVEKAKRKIKGIKGDELDELIDLVNRIPEDEREDYLQALRMRMEKGKQKQLDAKVAKELEKMQEELQALEAEDAIGILEGTREEIQDRKEEIMEEDIKRKEGNTQTVSSGGYTH
ncbi:MAG: hypothetical protein HFJ34_05685 [Clostridia bacterium]|nr:hypothetical protein [Clostridia bacterium]